MIGNLILMSHFDEKGIILNMETQKEVMSVSATAKFIGVCESKVRQLVREKRIPHIPLDGRIVFLTSEIIEWLKSQQVSPSQVKSLVDLNSNRKMSSEESSAIIATKLWRKGASN